MIYPKPDSTYLRKKYNPKAKKIHFEKSRKADEQGTCLDLEVNGMRAQDGFRVYEPETLNPKPL